MAANGGREVNYWPGFVDALTNTVIAMVFLVIVLTLSLSVFINSVANQRAAKMVETKAEKVKDLPEPSDTSAPPEAAKNPASTQASQISPSVLRGEFRVAAGPQKPSSESQRTSGVAANALLLYFPGTSVEVDEKTERELDRVAANSGVAFAQMEAIVSARGPQIFLSENQRLAFFRAMSVRNFLLKKGIRRDNIKILIEDAPGTTEGVVAVSVRKASTP